MDFFSIRFRREHFNVEDQRTIVGEKTREEIFHLDFNFLSFSCMRRFVHLRCSTINDLVFRRFITHDSSTSNIINNEFELLNCIILDLGLNIYLKYFYLKNNIRNNICILYFVFQRSS